jgi:hypothetical protein
MANVDFRIGRDFTIRERYTLSLVGEAFNLFNFTNFYAVNTQQFSYAGPGLAGCVGHTNGCLIPAATFLTPSASNNSLFGARQLQITGRFTF